MISYENEVENEAIGFLADHEEMILAALIANASWDYNEIEDLDQLWHECIVDRSYTAEDAIYILDNCKEEEDGMDFPSDHREALSMKAAYSFGNDVWFKAEEFYKEMNARRIELFEDPEDPATEGDNPEETHAKQAYDEIISRYGDGAIAPVNKNSPEEKQAIHLWLSLGATAGGYWFGYPAGSAYIDSRCGTGHGMPDVKEFVDYDHEFAKKVPWLAGKRKEEVQARYDELVERSRPDHPLYADYRIIDVLPCKQASRPKLITDIIWGDKRLTVLEIREIAQTLMGRVG